MIKLQLLLRRPSLEPELDPALRALLEAHAMRVTGSGRASVSAQMQEADFERLFGPVPDLASGFAPHPLAAPDLAVPPGLADAITLITIAPRHSAMNHSPRVKHAAI